MLLLFSECAHKLITIDRCRPSTDCHTTKPKLTRIKCDSENVYKSHIVLVMCIEYRCIYILHRINSTEPNDCHIEKITNGIERDFQRLSALILWHFAILKLKHNMRSQSIVSTSHFRFTKILFVFVLSTIHRSLGAAFFLVGDKRNDQAT